MGLWVEYLISTPPPCRPGGGVTRYRILKICIGRPNRPLRPANRISHHSDDDLLSGSLQAPTLILDFHVITCHGQFYHLLRAHPWVQQYALRKRRPHPHKRWDGVYELSSILNRPLLAAAQASRTLQPLSSRGITGEDSQGGCCRTSQDPGCCTFCCIQGLWASIKR